MKKEIHPAYYPDAHIRCSCGQDFKLGSTKEFTEVEICSKCHPFFTGERRATAKVGQVQKFKDRMDKKAKK
ncbi:MAG: 50S ribosomal protein L31 [Candidatus Paceibacterota bacterium]|jgi:large subunit ribosomal protein L31